MNNRLGSLMVFPSGSTLKLDPPTRLCPASSSRPGESEATGLRASPSRRDSYRTTSPIQCALPSPGFISL